MAQRKCFVLETVKTFWKKETKLAPFPTMTSEGLFIWDCSDIGLFCIDFYKQQRDRIGLARCLHSTNKFFSYHIWDLIHVIYTGHVRQVACKEEADKLAELTINKIC